MVRRALTRLAIGVAILAALAYLRDPPWMGRVTVGLRDWEQGADGVRFRWTGGRASFFVPRNAVEMTLPMRAVYRSPDGLPVTVEILVDDLWLATIQLPDPDTWVRSTFPLRYRPTTRRFRRVDLRISRIVGFNNRGIQIGDIALE
jgi:hypothetical protein